jgi:putative hydrolase of the HAD superfamily
VKKLLLFMPLKYGIIIIEVFNMTKGILIDMGDTLIHTKNMDFNRSYSMMYDLSKTKNCTKEEFLQYCSKFYKDIFGTRKYLEVRLIDLIKLLIEIFDLSYDISLEELEVKFCLNCSDISEVDNAHKILKYFKNKGYKIVVLSNTCFSRKAIVTMLGRFNEYFDEVIASSEYAVRKPYESFFDLGISKFAINKDDIYYIGNDYYFDIYGSSRAGLKSVWLNELNKSRDENLPVKEYIEINNYNELINMEF